MLQFFEDRLAAIDSQGVTEFLKGPEFQAVTVALGDICSNARKELDSFQLDGKGVGDILARESLLGRYLALQELQSAFQGLKETLLQTKTNL